jgi:hypothetical protein
MINLCAAQLLGIMTHMSGSRRRVVRGFSAKGQKLIVEDQ